MKVWLQKLEKGLTHLEGYLLLLLLIVMIAAAFLSMILRWMGHGLAWIDPLLRYGVLWLGLVGGLAAAGAGQHIQLGALNQVLPRAVKALTYRLVSLATAGITLVIAKACLDFVIEEKAAGTRAFGETPLWILVLILPAGFFLLSVRYSLRFLLGEPQDEEASP